MPNRGRSLNRRSLYRKANKKANLAFILSNLEQDSVATHSLNITNNNSDLHAVALTSNTCADTCNVQHNFSISSVCENEFLNTSDTEMFDKVVSNNFTLNDLSVNSNENYLDENNISIDNDICIANNIYRVSHFKCPPQISLSFLILEKNGSDMFCMVSRGP